MLLDLLCRLPQQSAVIATGQMFSSLRRRRTMQKAPTRADIRARLPMTLTGALLSALWSPVSGVPEAEPELEDMSKLTRFICRVTELINTCN